METGGETERRGRSDLGRLLEAIGSCEVLEKRIPLMKQLEDSYQFSADDLGQILQGLLQFRQSWIDSTCSGVSHCTLHRSILQVALKCSDLDMTDYLGQFLTLGAKATSWCGKHLQWSIKCIDESQVVQEEEHDRLRLEINSLSFNICTKLLGVAAKCFTVLEIEVAAGEEGQVCLLNKADDDFPTLDTMAAEVERLAVGPRTKRVQRMAPWSLVPVLSPPPQEALRRWCTHCGPEKTPQWRPGLAGPGTLCNVCAHPLKDSVAAAASWTNTLFREARLLHSNSRRRRGRPSKKRRHSSKQNYSAAGNVAGASLDAFFDHTGLEVSWEPEPAEEEELEWLDVFRSVETMAAEVDETLALEAPRARTKGRRQRVTAMETTFRQAIVRHGDLHAENVPPVRRCTHCGTEKAPQWRKGPEGPRTLCNACGLVYKKTGRLLPEYRPANSPAFSPLLHSNTYRGALQMHRQNETTSAACHGGAPSELMEGQLLQLANSPASSSPLPLYSVLEERRQSEEVTSAASRATSKASRGEARHESMEVQQPLLERPPTDRPAFSLVYHRRVRECRRRSEEEPLAVIRATDN